MNRTVTAPRPAMSPADKAAHFAATGPIRGHNGDSDPDVNEALRRVRGGKAFDAVLRRVETEVAYIERDAQLAADVAKDLAADATDGNWVPEANWVPNVAPEPADMWDEVIDGYSLGSAA